nr:ribonuclease H-like domain-containing protein [Tanacetum cinerariifolium]
MRIAHYIRMMEYALWDVIENRNSIPKTQTVNNVETFIPPTIVEEKLQRRNGVKARSTLMIGIPNKHQLKFNSFKYTKSLMEAIEKRELILPRELLLPMELILLALSQPNSTQLVNEDLEQIHPDDLEEMDLKWQMAMLTMRVRRFLKNTGRKLNLNENDSFAFDKTKVECYNCHKRGHFVRECRTPRGQDNRSRDVTRKTVPIETSNTSALLHLQILRDRALTKLQRKLDLAETKKEGIQLNVNKLENTSKSLNKIIECQIVDNCKKGLGYNAVPPPHTGLFPPPKSDLSSTGLEELFNEPKTEKSKDKSNEVEPEFVRKNSDAPIIKDWVLDDEEEEVEKKEVKPSINRINFVKATTDNNPRKTYKNGEQPKQNTHRKRDYVSSHSSASITLKKFNYGNPQEHLQDKGVIDSGCSRHMTGNMSILKDYKEIDRGYVAFGGNPKGGKITGKGKIKTGKLDFENVYFVRELKFNLFSVSQICDKKNSILFTDTECIVLSPDFKLIDENQILLRVPRQNNMYSIDLKNIVPTRDLTCLFAKATEDESKLWHRRLGHLNFKTINKLVKRNLVRGTKDETSGTLKSIITRVKNLMNLRVKIIRSDNGTEFKNKEMNQFCEVKGIMRQYSVARTPQQNRVIEMRNRTLIEATRTMLADSKMPTTFWAEAVNIVCYSSQHNEFHPSNDGAKRVNEDLRKENKCNHQGEEDSTNSTNRVNIVTSNINAVSSSRVNIVCTNISIDLPPDLNMPSLEDISIFEDSYDDEDVFSVEADFHNLGSTFQVSPILTTRIYKDYPLKQVIGDLHSAPQTRRMLKNLEEHGLVVTVFKNKMDERGIVIRNKARLVAQGHTHEEGIDYDKVFAPVARIEAIRLFLAYASFKDFIVYQMDVKSASLYGKIEEEVYVCQPPGFEDPDFPNKVYKVEKALYGLHQAPRAWHDLKLNDTEGTSCLFNAVIIEELARMGYEKPSEKLTFYKDFFLPQWKFFIHTILQCLSTKTTSWNKFSSTMESAIICLANNQKFNFSMYILDNLKKNLEAGIPFYMFLRFIQVFVNNQLGDMSYHKGIYVNPSLTKKVFAYMKRLRTWFSGALTPLFGTMMRKHKPKRKERKEIEVSPTEIHIEDYVPTSSNDPLPSGEDRIQLKELMDLCTNLSNKVLDLENEVIETKSSHKAKIAELESRVEKLEEKNTSLTKELKSFNTRVESPAIKENVPDKEESSKQGRKIADIDVDAEVNLENVYNLDMAHEETVLSMQDVDVQSERIDADVKEVVKEMAEEGPEMDAERIKAPKKRTRKEKVEKDQTVKKKKGDELEQDNTEKQKLEEQHEVEEIKRNLEIVPDDEDDVFVNVTLVTPSNWLAAEYWVWGVLIHGSTTQ